MNLRNLRRAGLISMALVFSFTGAFVFGGNSSKKEPVLATVSSVDAYRIIQENKGNKNFRLLDVRTPGEFREKRIRGAVNIDFHSPDFEDNLKKLRRNMKILVYCRSGNRSRGAMAVMEDLGFKEVYNMDGGLIQWEANDYPLEKSGD